MVDSLKHILIIWSDALAFKDEIIGDIRQDFEILNIHRFHWTQKYFKDNLKRFYSHSQKHLDDNMYDAIIENKIKHCGQQAFIGIVFEDHSPIFEARKTSNGINTVNKNVFDKKQKFRKWTGGGHRIHASDNYFETNKDLALLLGCDINTYTVAYPKQEEEIMCKSDIIGVPFWKDLKQLFFVLNNAIDYVVLRNFENIPESYFVSEHGDIDLLVSDRNYTKFLTGAKAVYPELDYRVYFNIEFENENVPFDFRFIGDNYYDKNWQLGLLENRVYDKNGFYKPDKISHFYSLLYHAYVHKLVVASDYEEMLLKLAENLGVPYDPSSIPEIAKLLNTFLKENNFEYTIPFDYSVVYNKKFIELLDYKGNKPLGKLISSSISRTLDKSFITEVFENDSSFVKRGTYPIAENENYFLQILSEYTYFPTIQQYEEKKQFSDVYLDKVRGDLLEQVNTLKSFWNKANIINFIFDCVAILEILALNNICHRDIRPANIILKVIENGYRPVLIDFGWGINIGDKEVIEPFGLGSKQRWPGVGYSDAYSMGVSLGIYLDRLPFVRSYTKTLKNISPDDYNDIPSLLKKFEELKKEVVAEKKKFNIRDAIFLLIKKYRLRLFMINTKSYILSRLKKIS